MKINCIICGRNCREKLCVGTINEMQVVFCDEHSEHCDNYETMECILLTDWNNIN